MNLIRSKKFISNGMNTYIPPSIKISVNNYNLIFNWNSILDTDLYVIESLSWNRFEFDLSFKKD